MENSIQQALIEAAETKYKMFTASLLPGIENILGIRLPILRGMAKKIAKEDWRSYLQSAENTYFEEIMLQGMVIGYADIDAEERLKLIKKFVPLINNWSVCDSFCNGLKFTKENKEKVWEFLQSYLLSDKEYDIRFGVVMILNYYVEEEYALRAFALFNQITKTDYYVMMAVAWAVSAYYIKLPEIALTYLKDNSLDDTTYNKALQKIGESLKVSHEDKKMIRSMKRV